MRTERANWGPSVDVFVRFLWPHLNRKNRPKHISTINEQAVVSRLLRALDQHENVLMTCDEASCPCRRRDTRLMELLRSRLSERLGLHTDRLSQLSFDALDGVVSCWVQERQR